jgi:hypothetical protein
MYVSSEKCMAHAKTGDKQVYLVFISCDYDRSDSVEAEISKENVKI